MGGGGCGGAGWSNIFEIISVIFIYIFNYLCLFLVKVCLMGGLIYELSLKKIHTRTQYYLSNFIRGDFKWNQRILARSSSFIHTHLKGV